MAQWFWYLRNLKARVKIKAKINEVGNIKTSRSNK